jgi:hypothetical protein
MKFLQNVLRCIGFFCTVFFVSSSFSHELWDALTKEQMAPGMLVQLPSARNNAEIPVYIRQTPGAIATLVLLPGGAGGIGKVNEIGWPEGNNFLIRSGPLFATHGFNLVMMSRSSDMSDMDYSFRISAPAVDDLRRVLIKAKETFPGPVWVVGTSRGTVSGTAAAIALREQGLIDGLVLTSSITAKAIGAVPTQALADIKIPVMVLHHESDACNLCVPSGAASIDKGLINSPKHTLVMFTGGANPKGDPCAAMHYHGFIGAEAQAVAAVAQWIKSPVN